MLNVKSMSDRSRFQLVLSHP